MYSRGGQIAFEDASISDQPLPADEADELIVQTEVGMPRCSPLWISLNRHQL